MEEASGYDSWLKKSLDDLLKDYPQTQDSGAQSEMERTEKLMHHLGLNTSSNGNDNDTATDLGSEAVKSFFNRFNLESGPHKGVEKISENMNSQQHSVAMSDVDDLLGNNVNKVLHVKSIKEKLNDGKMDEQNIHVGTSSTPQGKDVNITLKDNLLDMRLKYDLIEKHLNPEYQDSKKKIEMLPVYKMKDTIIELINNNKVVVISGSTGCGKTTQLAQFILDYEIMKGCGSTCHIVCTQPRRISAVSVAERVAYERAEVIGDSVGYQVRLGMKLPREHGCILFCTTGILIQNMVSNPDLLNISHILLDEIHERDVNSDLLLAVIKDMVQTREDLKVVLMSATLNSVIFSKYFDNCPMLDIPGNLHQVSKLYLEDALEILKLQPNFSVARPAPPRRKLNLVKTTNTSLTKKKNDYLKMITPYIRKLRTEKVYSEEVINRLSDFKIEFTNNDFMNMVLNLIIYICKKPDETAAGILIFLPGWDNITTLIEMMEQSKLFPKEKYLIIHLHSSSDQTTVFKTPPQGIRKIVVSTNIAETSITIDDIVYVIDCGQAKKKRYDASKNVTSLQQEFISHAEADQRRGRAGRLRPGVCFHLFSKAREENLRKYPEPEIKRISLEEVILDCKLLKFGRIKPFLQKTLDPPDEVTIDASLKFLTSFGAVDDNENLTFFGQHLARLPMDPFTGKMVILGALFKCLDPILSITACLSIKEPFTMPLNKKEYYQRRAELGKGRKSDHLLMFEAFKEWERAEILNCSDEFCNENFLIKETLEYLREIKFQFAEHLKNIGFLENSNYTVKIVNINSDNIGLLRAIISAALQPNIAFVTNTYVHKEDINLRVPVLETYEDKNVTLHRKSVNYDVTKFESKFLVYYVKHSLNIKDTTMCHIKALLLFAKKIELVSEVGTHVVKIQNIRISLTPEIQTILNMRQKLNSLIDKKMKNPSPTNWDETTEEGRLLREVVRTITEEEEALMPIYKHN